MAGKSDFRLTICGHRTPYSRAGTLFFSIKNIFFLIFSTNQQRFFLENSTPDKHENVFVSITFSFDNPNADQHETVCLKGFACVCVCVRMCMYVSMYVRMYVCMYVCMYVYEDANADQRETVLFKRVCLKGFVSLQIRSVVASHKHVY